MCGDGVDNDLDGLVDSDDPECTSPCDHDESVFENWVGDKAAGYNYDCYFDAGAGSGDDGCIWNLQCDPLMIAPDYLPSPDDGAQCAYDESATAPGNKTCAELRTEQPPTCLGYCGSNTPNGCDCFGCCEVSRGSGSFVWLGSPGCSMASAGDPSVCHPCTPVPSCFNDCTEQEVCIGNQPPIDGCGGPDQCPAGIDPCGLPGQPACPSGQYCVSGCCRTGPN